MQDRSAQVSCHDAPIFRLLLKIAVSLGSSNVTFSIFARLLAANISSSHPNAEVVFWGGLRFAPVALLFRGRSWVGWGWLVNLPGWRWATIKQVALDRLSRSLHSDVCDSDGCCDAVLHSTISGRGSRRERAALNISSRSFASEILLPMVPVCTRRVLFAAA